jgi:ADP-ribosyl-[dinitrogen reductase] hydrolase
VRFRHEAIAGAILGGAIGDALGGIAERGVLTFSDDTQLTVATCEAILAAQKASPQAIAAQMLAWFLAGRVSGIGSSTLKAMRDFGGGCSLGARGRPR